MALPKLDPYVSVEEYLQMSRESAEKLEYVAGDVYTMTGASPNHALITANVGAVLGNGLWDTPCRVYSSRMRIRTDLMNTFRYPDVSIACEDPKFSEDNPASLLNPVLLVEVLSESTEMADRGAKLMEYQSIPSLQTYLLVAQDAPIVQAYFRDGEAWRLQTFTDTAAEIIVPQPSCMLAMSAIYQKVVFEDDRPSES